jgi:hypothetical protein
MHSTGAQLLIAGGTITAIAAVAHLACIAFGAPAYGIMAALGLMFCESQAYCFCSAVRSVAAQEYPQTDVFRQ